MRTRSGFAANQLSCCEYQSLNIIGGMGKEGLSAILLIQITRSTLSAAGWKESASAITVPRQCRKAKLKILMRGDSPATAAIGAILHTE
jgi:hypothetical protein